MKQLEIFIEGMKNLISYDEIIKYLLHIIADDDKKNNKIFLKYYDSITEQSHLHRASFSAVQIIESTLFQLQQLQEAFFNKLQMLQGGKCCS